MKHLKVTLKGDNGRDYETMTTIDINPTLEKQAIAMAESVIRMQNVGKEKEIKLDYDSVNYEIVEVEW